MTLPAGAAVLVDTDVASFLLRRQDTRAALYRPHVRGRLLAISFMTLAELEQWAELHGWGEVRRQELAAHVAGFRIFHSAPELCRWWARVRTSARRSGRPIGPADAWIAATALMFQMPLITHNPDDFAGVTGLIFVTKKP